MLRTAAAWVARKCRPPSTGTYVRVAMTSSVDRLRLPASPCRGFIPTYDRFFGIFPCPCGLWILYGFPNTILVLLRMDMLDMRSSKFDEGRGLRA